jgi:hypothetical protein
MGEDTSEIREEIEQTRGKMGDTVEALTHKADVPGRVKESVADKRNRLRSQMSGAASKVSDATPDSGNVKQGAKQAVGVAQENPIGLALGGVAVGFLAGMLVPSTRVEDERIGPVADDVKQKAKTTGEEAVQRGRRVAEAASATAAKSGRSEAKKLSSSTKKKTRQASSSARKKTRS